MFNLTYHHSAHTLQLSIDFFGYTISDSKIKPNTERLQSLKELPLHENMNSLHHAIGI